MILIKLSTTGSDTHNKKVWRKVKNYNVNWIKQKNICKIIY